MLTYISSILASNGIMTDKAGTAIKMLSEKGVKNLDCTRKEFATFFKLASDSTLQRPIDTYGVSFKSARNCHNVNNRQVKTENPIIVETKAIGISQALKDFLNKCIIAYSGNYPAVDMMANIGTKDSPKLIVNPLICKFLNERYAADCGIFKALSDKLVDSDFTEIGIETAEMKNRRLEAYKANNDRIRQAMALLRSIGYTVIKTADFDRYTPPVNYFEFCRETYYQDLELPAYDGNSQFQYADFNAHTDFDNPTMMVNFRPYKGVKGVISEKQYKTAIKTGAIYLPSYPSDLDKADADILIQDAKDKFQKRSSMTLETALDFAADMARSKAYAEKMATYAEYEKNIGIMISIGMDRETALTALKSAGKIPADYS